MYPFTVYHASAKMTRRYTLYASTDAVRQKWNAALVDAMGVRKVRQEANMVGIGLRKPGRPVDDHLTLR